MTRHSKNNTSNSIFTYHERKKVTDFNSLKQRLGSSSMRRCEQCWLCLATAIKPVTTPFGYIFCRECIITNLSKQMEENKKKIRQWEQEMELHKTTLEEEEKLNLADKKRKFVEENLYGIISDKRAKVTSKGSKFKEDHKEGPINSFWTSDSKLKANERDKQELARPKNILTCPISGKLLKVKDLVDLNPETIRESDDTDSHVWICSISKKPISHHPACAIKKSGRIVLRKFLGTEEEIDSNKGDLYISIIPGGTGFSSHNNVEATKFRPSMQ